MWELIVIIGWNKNRNSFRLQTIDVRSGWGIWKTIQTAVESSRNSHLKESREDKNKNRNIYVKFCMLNVISTSIYKVSHFHNIKNWNSIGLFLMSFRKKKMSRENEIKNIFLTIHGLGLFCICSLWQTGMDNGHSFQDFDNLYILVTECRYNYSIDGRYW